MSRRARVVGFATERIVVSLRRYERTRALVDGDPSLAREIVREVEDELGAEALEAVSYTHLAERPRALAWPAGGGACLRFPRAL